MQRIVTFARQTKKNVTELNLFDNETNHTDPFALRTAILSTRAYIVILLVSVITLVVFNSVGTQPDIVLLLNPSQSTYEDFLDKYGNLSSCPCSRITIPYVNFTSTIVNYHPICQSIFISNDWINHLFNPEFLKLYQPDFRVVASNYFQLLATFCSHIEQSVNDTLKNFHLQTFLTPNVLSYESLDAEINATSYFLRSSIINSVHQLLHLVSNTTHSNKLQTAIPLSTIMLMYTSNDMEIIEMKDIRYIYGGSSACFCSAIEHCSLPSAFYNSSQRFSVRIASTFYIIPQANVPGFFVGCFPVESLLKSTLECLFDSLCLDTIHTFIPSSNITGVYTLNRNQTRFPPNTSVQDLIDQLFLEEWLIKTNFSNYYTQCAPILCSHTLSKRKSPLYIITKLLSLYGGLTAVLRFCLPRIITLWRKRRMTTAVQCGPAQSFVRYLQMIWQVIRIKMPQLILFKTRTMRTDPFEQYTLKISTWIYLFLLISSTIIIVFFNWFSVRIESNTVTNVTLDKYQKLYNKYLGSLQCPCNVLTIPHSSYISISPRFHPVCTSLFTTNWWITTMSNKFKLHDGLIYKDIFEVGGDFSANLQTFCILMSTIVSDAALIFNQSSLVTNQVLSNVEFMKRTRQIFDQFTYNTIAEAKRSLALIRSQTLTMYTTGNTDVSWRRISWHNHSDLIGFQPVATDIGNCSCRLNDNCKQKVAHYDFEKVMNPVLGPPDVLYYISNMFSGCFATHSLLQSSLECFFIRKCAGPIINYIGQDVNTTLLQVNSTRFPPKMLLGKIFDKLMIETWNEEIRYDRYYEQCAPQNCTYSVTSRNNALYAFTTMIGLFGGLSTALRILIPRIVTWIRNRFYRRNNRNVGTASYTLRERLRALFSVIKKTILELNLFESEASWDNEDRRHQEIITTRLYLFFLTFALIIIVIYTTVTIQTQSFKKTNPSQSDFGRLIANSRYSPTLDCPCQNISIPYKSFISMTPYYHQLCSSDFIIHNSIWINLIYTESDLPTYSYDNYRHFVVPHFRLLFYLCTVANDTLTNALLNFHSNTLISTRAQSREAVVAQVEANINQFGSSLPQMFMRTLDFIQQIAQGNGLVSSSVSNWYPIPQTANGFLSMAPRTYGNNNCSCATNSKCVSSAAINGWSVPGFLIGCYPLESLLQSTLECLYNMTCIHKLKNKNQSSYMNIRPLDAKLSFPNVTVRSLMDRLMVDRWEPNINYDKYYASCSPLSCTYVVRERANSVYITTTIIGCFGGLTVALKIFVPMIIKLVRYAMMCHRRRVAPNVAVIS